MVLQAKTAVETASMRAGQGELATAICLTAGRKRLAVPTTYKQQQNSRVLWVLRCRRGRNRVDPFS
jgi:hypothetical protein